MRRTVSASMGAALALAASILGVVTAYAGLIAGWNDDLSALAHPPVAHLLVLLVGLPVLTAAVSWSVAGREPASFTREALR